MEASRSHGLCCLMQNSTQWFAAVSGDNRLKIWNTTSNMLSQHFTDGEQLTNAFTAIAATELKGKRAGTGPKGVVALGTENGTILVYQTDMGEVSHRFGGPGSSEGHSSQVNHLVFNPAGTVLYSCSQDKQIIEWDLQSGTQTASFSGGKGVVTRLGVSPDGSSLVSAGTGLKVWDLSSKKVMRKFSGHSTPVTCLAFSPDGKFIVSGAGDRFVSMWDCSESSETGSKKERNSIHTFTLDSPPTLLDFNPFLGAKATKRSKKSTSQNYHIGAISSSSQTYIWQWTSTVSSSTSTSNSTTTPDCLIKMPPTAAAVPTPAETSNKRKRKAAGMSGDAGLAAQLAMLSFRFESKTEITVVRGSLVLPAAQTIRYFDNESILSALVLDIIAEGARLLGQQSSEALKSRKVATSVSAIDPNLVSTNGKQSSALDGASKSR